LYVGDLATVVDLFASAAVNTDDHPLIEFLAPRLTHISAAGDKDWFTGEALATFYDTVEARLASSPDPLFPASEAVADARRAGTALYRYALASAQHDNTTAAQFEAEVRRLVPEVVLAAEFGNSSASLAEARRELTGLRTEQTEVRHRLEKMEQQLRDLTDSGEPSE
jgi:hypothetical protein